MSTGRPFNVPANLRWDQGYGTMRFFATYGPDGLPVGGVQGAPFALKVSAEHGARRATKAGHPSVVVAWENLWIYIRAEDLDDWEMATQEVAR